MSKNVLLIGNPNCGKTTLFNLLTGQHQKVGNWSGVTTEGKVGYYVKDKGIMVTDLPGLYSLSVRTDDEKAVINRLMNKNIDLIINVVDGLNLERNLYLTTELLTLGFPVVLAINFSDQLLKKNIKIDTDKLSKKLGVKVVLISAATNKNIDELMTIVKNSITISNSYNDDFQKFSPKMRYEFIERTLSECVKKSRDRSSKFAGKIDNVLMNKYLGLPIFILVTCLMYLLSIRVGGAVGGLIENVFDNFSQSVYCRFNALNFPEWFLSLICQAIIKSLGIVFAFLPQILILFAVLTCLEESGYSARAAFIIDKLFSFFGLSGKAFIPMMLCTGCTVTGLMAARTIDGENEKRSVIFLSPFMPCGAKMAVFGWFSSVFFGGSAILATAMYFLGIFCVIMFGRILNFFSKKHKENSLFLLEIPTLKLPRIKVIFEVLVEKIKDYLLKVGSIIFIISVVLWALSSFGARGYVGKKIELSFLYTIGNALKWLFYPLGFGNWQATVAILSGTFAKEAVIETLALLTNEPSLLFQNSFSVYSFCSFVLLAPPCVASVIQAYSELKSKRLIFYMLSFEFTVAYIVSFVINILGLIFSTAQGLIIFLILAIIIVALAFAVKFAFAKNCKLKCLNCKGAKICRRKEKHSTI